MFSLNKPQVIGAIGRRVRQPPTLSLVLTQMQHSNILKKVSETYAKLGKGSLTVSSELSSI